ncbi:MAG: hypothetical protein M3537_10600, partial [Chloroflexota bacterium]|nr:hypothetical protein [Chloroflexota bacterium]
MATGANVLQPGPTPAERTRMSHRQVVRWTRFGHDRLYVKTLAGVQLGYWDNNGHVACLEDAANRPMFDQVIAEYRAGRPDGCAPTSASSDPVTVDQGNTAGIETVIARTEPRPNVPVPEWTDMSANPAGASC